MKKIFTLIIIFSSFIFCKNSLLPAFAAEQSSPTISITKTPAKENESGKLIKVKTTIVTQKTEKPEPELPSIDVKKAKPDIELSSDVDKILKEMDIDDADPLGEEATKPANNACHPMKQNFFWIALAIISFPILLFVLMIKTMQVAKTRFEKEEKEKGLSKEEKLLDELEKEQKKTKKKPRSLSEILGGSKQKPVESTAYEDDFDREDEDFEFMVEEVVLVEEKPEEPELMPEQEQAPEQEPESSPEVQPKKEKATSGKKSKAEKKEEKEEITVPEEPVLDGEPQVIDTFEVDSNLKFLLVKKDEACSLVCKLQEREIVVMNLDKAQKFNKVRKIDSKPGRDVYMVKLDSWRGLVEVKEDSVKYLMDI